MRDRLTFCSKEKFYMLTGSNPKLTENRGHSESISMSRPMLDQSKLLLFVTRLFSSLLYLAALTILP
jgi:hypothetical protein